MPYKQYRRKFLKFLAFKEDGVYPNQGIDHSILQDRFELLPLERRRAMLSVKFLFNLVHNRIDCSWLLNKLSFVVPRLEARNVKSFMCNIPKTNCLVRSPIRIMCNNFNTISNLCDIHHNSIKRILTIAALNL